MSNDDKMRNEIKNQIEDSISLKKKISDDYVDRILKISKEIIKAYNNHKKVIWFGNGGSAADAQHLACELVSKFYMERKALRSLALNTNSSILTAISNDYSFDHVYERQIEAFAETGDILIGISTSGTSPNIVKALELGKKIGTVNVALIGKNKEKVKDVADYIIDVPSDETARVQESHIMIGHIICYLVEKSLFAKKS